MFSDTDSCVQRVVSFLLMSVMHESLDRLHTDLLVAIKHTGLLRRAAEMLAISPSAASHRLKEGERRLGIELAVADGRTLRLTAAGEHLADAAEIAQSSLRSAEETARWMAAADRPTVRLALDFYDTAPWFERLIGLEDRSSDLDFVRVAYDGTRDAVFHRRADLGVVVVPAAAPPDGVLVADELAAVVRADHPARRRGVLDPADIGEATYVTAGDRPQHGFEHHEFFEPAGVRPDRLRKVESLAMVLRLIRSYGGITVQPRLALREAHLADLAIVPLRDTSIGVRWQFVLRPDPTEAELDMCEAIRLLVA